jgi:hypothetical protein
MTKNLKVLFEGTHVPVSGIVVFDDDYGWYDPGMFQPPADQSAKLAAVAADPDAAVAYTEELLLREKELRAEIAQLRTKEIYFGDVVAEVLKRWWMRVFIPSYLIVRAEGEMPKAG